MSGRRLFLKRAGVVAAAGLALPGCNVLIQPDLRAIAEAMAGLLNRRDLARSIGQRFLVSTGTPDTASMESLAGSLLDSIGMDVDSMTYLSVDRLRDALADRIRADFESENTATVDGWMLSRTECLLCAVGYLHG